jgi:hypothetical protein
LILAAMRLRRVEIDGRNYAAAPTQVSTVVTPPAPAAKNLGVGLQRPYSADVQQTEYYLRLYLHCGKLALAAIARAALLLRHKTSAWASWLPHWLTCMCAKSRKDSIDSIQQIFSDCSS